MQCIIGLKIAALKRLGKNLDLAFNGVDSTEDVPDERDGKEI